MNPDCADCCDSVQFALVWLPPPAVTVRRKSTFILTVAVLALAGALALCWWPERLPSTWSAGRFSPVILAVNALGGLGFLASGYLSAADLADRRGRLEELTDRPFGVNIAQAFVEVIHPRHKLFPNQHGVAAGISDRYRFLREIGYGRKRRFAARADLRE